jgi:hypothetical protein
MGNVYQMPLKEERRLSRRSDGMVTLGGTLTVVSNVTLMEILVFTY